MKFLVFGDVCENTKALEKFSSLDFSDCEFVVFTGDLLTLSPFKKLREEKVLRGEIPKNVKDRKLLLKDATEPKDILNKEVHKLKGFAEYFKKIRDEIPLYVVWGNADHRWIFSQTEIDKYVANLHLNPTPKGNYILVGYQGRPKYIFETYDNPTERAFNENKTFKELSEIFQKSKGKILLITHAPPYTILDQVEEKYRRYALGTYGERAKDGHIGSIAFKKITKEFKPFLHIFGHIHEAKGIKKLGETTYVNTGSFGKKSEFVEINILENIPEIRFIRL